MRRRRGSCAWACSVAALMMSLCATPGAAQARADWRNGTDAGSLPVTTQTFSNSSPIAVTAVSQSTITVAGMPSTTVSDVNVSVNGMTWDPNAATVHVRLQSPLGQVIDLMSDACTTTTMAAPGATYVFDDQAATEVPSDNCPATGTFRPTDYLTIGGGPPPAPTISELFRMNGLDPNGTWTLYALSTVPVAASVTAGWSISFQIPDTQAPATTITRPPHSSTRHHVRVAFGSDDPGAHFRCKRDLQPYRACTPPKVLRHLEVGRHVVRVEAIDDAGNVDPTPAVARWRVQRRT